MTQNKETTHYTMSNAVWNHSIAGDRGGGEERGRGAEGGERGRGGGKEEKERKADKRRKKVEKEGGGREGDEGKERGKEKVRRRGRTADDYAVAMSPQSCQPRSWREGWLNLASSLATQCWEGSRIFTSQGMLLFLCDWVTAWWSLWPMVERGRTKGCSTEKFWCPAET